MSKGDESERPGERRVLLVDDLDQFRLTLEQLLASKGYSVRGAPSVDAAFEIIADWLPDVIISDYRMPMMDGNVLLEEVRRRWPAMVEEGRFAFLTAVNLDEIRRATDCRDVRIFEKPFRLSDLLEFLASVLGERG